MAGDAEGGQLTADQPPLDSQTPEANRARLSARAAEECDPLHDEGAAYARCLQDTGVEVELH